MLRMKRKSKTLLSFLLAGVIGIAVFATAIGIQVFLMPGFKGQTAGSAPVTQNALEGVVEFLFFPDFGELVILLVLLSPFGALAFMTVRDFFK